MGARRPLVGDQRYPAFGRERSVSDIGSISHASGQARVVPDDSPHGTAPPSWNGGTDMPSGPTRTTTTSAYPPIRLRLKPAAQGAAGYVDGGWWPRSRDLAGELPPLLAALSPRLGAIERVSYHLGDWDPSVRRIKIDGRATRLGGFRSQRPHTIDVLGARLRLTLLVVPPDASGQAGQRSLTTAGHAGNIDSIADLLAAQSQTPEG
jgi:hypothetical protein